MDYISKFQNNSEYTVSATPNVSLVVDEKEVRYEKKDFSDEYLTFIALENGTFTLTIGSAVTTNNLTSISYSVDGGETWTTTNNINGQRVTITTPIVNAGGEVLWKGIANIMAVSISSDGFSVFSSTGEYEVRGNIMSLLYGDGFEGQTSLGGKSFCFHYLFYVSNKLKSVKNLSLPATTLADSCYANMFQGCTSLTTAPELPATTLVSNCYSSMFSNCTSLRVAPVLSATTLAQTCYRDMFSGCANLTTAPELPATTLAQSCYNNMFYGCTSLTAAPELPATTLAQGCYLQMFYGCTSLVAAPALPATTLASACYSNMFQGCTALTVQPQLPATALTSDCYAFMFYGCTSLVAAPALPATTLASACYGQMFKNCTSLTTAPALPATTLANYCYYYMFDGCTSLKVAPVLNMITRWESLDALKSMFAGCTKLNFIKNTSDYYFYNESLLGGWVKNVSPSGVYVLSKSAKDIYLSDPTFGEKYIPKCWTVFYIDEYRILHYLGINGEEEDYYGYGYGYDYGYDSFDGYDGYYRNGADPMKRRYPFDFYQDTDNTDTFKVINTGSSTSNVTISIQDTSNNVNLFEEYHNGLVYSPDGYQWNDLSSNRFSLEGNDNVYLKGIMDDYPHAFTIDVDGNADITTEGDVVYLIDPVNIETSKYDDTWTTSGNRTSFVFDGFEGILNG